MSLVVVFNNKAGRFVDAARHARRLLALEPAREKQRANLEKLVARVGAAAVPAPPSVAACAHCGLPPFAGKLKRCTKCNAAWFCDRPCQLAAWPTRKRAAKAAKKTEGGAGGGAAPKKAGKGGEY